MTIPDEFQYHEALDRLHIAVSFVDSMLTDHAAIQAMPTVDVRVKESLQLLAQAYQICGEIVFEDKRAQL